jgi:hypothetical protein
MKIYDRPMIFATLNVSHLKRHGLVATQATSEQHSQQGTVPYAFEGADARGLPKSGRLFHRKSIPETHAEFLDPLDSRDPRCEVRTEKAAVGGLVH